jgi:tetratricopeptide (TPR) repeat protein
MKARILLLVATALSCFLGKSVSAQQKYQMQPITIQSRWAKEVSPGNALKEYPRPQMVRKQWTNLNGLWDYAITPKDSSVPLKAEGKILVPYPIESALSGVKKNLKPDQNLWYIKKLTTPKLGNDHVILHFGAVDYQTTVFIDGMEVGRHEGGYTEFSFDITKYLTKREHTLFVKVYDPSDQGIGPHGKQVLNPGNIYYTPSSGIWQTVWLESVPVDYITDLTITPDIDKAVINITVNSASDSPVELNVEGNIIRAESNKLIAVSIKDVKLWSPDNPYLYDLKVKLGKDEVLSYFGMRKINIAKDQEGVDRIFLNNRPYFNLGTLDQGFWPDGLYTAPTDEALAFDIKAVKAMGFNTIRKHIKVEPARWYYHADRLGMLVWQDMVNPNQGLPEGSKTAFEAEAKETVKQLHNYPSITTWVLFNEKWGQYDQARLSKWLKEADPSRLVNGHSGELLYVDEKLRSPSPDAYVNSDMTDVHSYPDPMMSIKQEGKAQVLGEFGGIGVFIDDHQWNPEIAWGYIQEKPTMLKIKYAFINQQLEHLQKVGLSASIYTQPFDVESEQNGLMTYDREVIKIPFTDIVSIHKQLNPTMGILPNVTVKDAVLTDPEIIYRNLLAQYMDGRRDEGFTYKLIIMSRAANDVVNLKLLEADYVNGLIKPYTKIKFQRVMKLTKSVNDPGFKFIYSNLAQINDSLGVNKADGKILGLVDIEINQLMHENIDNPNWVEIEKTIVRKFGKLGKEAYWKSIIFFYYTRSNSEGYAIAAKESLKLMQFLNFEYPNKANIRLGGMALNNMAWATFLSCSDPAILSKALEWSKYSLDETPNNYANIDTYANILYKLGRIKEAIGLERKALALTPEFRKQEIQGNLSKMEKGIKTWPDIK